MTAADEIVTPFPQLSDEQVDLGRAELFRHVGADASDTGWMRRLGRRGDGTWVLLVRATRPGLAGCEKNLFGPLGPQISAAYHPLAEGVRLVLAGAEAEADRLAKARVDHQDAAAKLAAAEMERMRLKQENDQRAEIVWKESKLRLRFDTWTTTPTWAQALLHQALIWAETNPVQARQLRELARSAIGRAGKRGESGGDLSLPEKEWW